MRRVLLTPSCACAADEMIYDDVENGDEGGNSSLEYGWSSSEFESYGEQSDSEGRNGVPRSFLRSSHRKQVRVGRRLTTHARASPWGAGSQDVHECFWGVGRQLEESTAIGRREGPSPRFASRSSDVTAGGKAHVELSPSKVLGELGALSV